MTKVQSADPAEWRLEVAASCCCCYRSLPHRPSPATRTTPLRSTGTLNLRIDNDMFGIGQDQATQWISRQLGLPNLVDYRDDPCLPVSSVG